jgi:hypothetical protein
MQYYDFTIDGDRVGYFEIEQRPGVLYMNARFLIEGEKRENPFWIRHVDERPREVKAGESKWQRVPDGTYPTSAYPFVLRAGLSRYRAFVEGTGHFEDRELRSEGGLLVEYSGERVTRKFGMQGDLITYICWGGSAESRLVDSKSEAVRGTVFDSPGHGH